MPHLGAMSKKHYIAIAAILRPHCDDGGSQEADEITLALANYFDSENPAFDRERFLKAAGFVA